MKTAATQNQPQAQLRRADLKFHLRKMHRKLAWLGFAAMLLWGLSGLLHPWLTTFGVQQKVFAPPQRQLDLRNSLPIENILQKAGIQEAVALKIVVGESSNLLQVTESQYKPRRYFKLQTGEELQNHDPLQALFLARHYMQLPDEEIASVMQITSFTEAYPSVNRLLPVYQVNFDRPDGLHVYIYTETSAVAGVSNRIKQQVQTAFQWFHTWSWVPAIAETPRVMVISMLVGTLFIMACTGMAMLVLIRRKVRAPGARGWHRLTTSLAVLPLLMFSFSGVYHVIQQGWPTGAPAIHMQPSMRLAGLSFPVHAQWAELTADIPLSGLSLAMSRQGELFYRFSLPRESKHLPQGEQAIREARFLGVQPTGPAIYLNAASGTVWPEGDREMALQLAEHYTGLDRSLVTELSLVTKFGEDYDFRNKRLPVWRVIYGEPRHDTIFIDTATGVLVDRTANSAKPELWSFSMLHKWSFLGSAGRSIQNLVMCAAVLLMLFAAFLGLKGRTQSKR